MTNNLYQRIYRNLFVKEAFDNSQRNAFEKQILKIELKKDEILKWNYSLSPLYSQEEPVFHIEGRYRNSNSVTHLTLEHLKTLPQYQTWLTNLRKQGWLNWQILLAMYIHICNYKTDWVLRGKVFPSEELHKEAFNKLFMRYVRKMNLKCMLNFLWSILLVVLLNSS